MIWNSLPKICGILRFLVRLRYFEQTCRIFINFISKDPERRCDSNCPSPGIQHIVDKRQGKVKDFSWGVISHVIILCTVNISSQCSWGRYSWPSVWNHPTETSTWRVDVGYFTSMSLTAIPTLLQIVPIHETSSLHSIFQQNSIPKALWRTKDFSVAATVYESVHISGWIMKWFTTWIKISSTRITNYKYNEAY